MKRHRLHKCRPWESYDVPKECLSFFKSRLAEDESANADLVKRIKWFCRKLESNLINKFRRKYEENSSLYKNIESSFGALSFIKRDENADRVTNLDKKLKVIGDLVQSTNPLFEVNAKKFLENVEQEKVSIVFPPMEEAMKLFEYTDLLEKECTAH